MMLQRGFVILSSCIITVLSAPATYDQRQTGDLNVQIHLKDLQVLALVDSELLDDYTDYDYFYDYADFTIKPTVKPTSSTSSTSTVAPWSTWPTNPPSSSSTDKIDDGESLNSSSQIPSHTTEAIEASSQTVTPEGEPQLTSENSVLQTLSEQPSTESSNDKTSIENKLEDSIVQTDAPLIQSSSSMEEPLSEKPVQQLSRKRCRSGFSPDGKGRCRRLNRRRLSFIPFAMRLAPKLLEMGAPNTIAKDSH